MSDHLSHRVKKLKPSATMAVAQRANELRAQGEDIISLSVGEPDFDTPQHIKTEASMAINDGFTKYTAVDGIPDLKKAIQAKFKNENKLDYELDQIMASTGAKQCLFNAMQALINPYDEVLIPTPYWVSYPSMVEIAEGKPVYIETDITTQFKVTPEKLEEKITAKTKMLVLNTPSNPSGMHYSAQELLALADVLEKHPHVFILTDDIYEHILWNNGPFQNIVNVKPDLFSRTLVVNGVSKAYSMTGWRLGYIAGPADIIKAMKKIQSQSTSNPCSITQIAGMSALKGDQECVQEMLEAFKKRHDFVYDALKNMPGFEVLPSDGTFYSFPRVEEAIKKLKLSDDIEFAEYLLNEAGVAVVPGTAFGAPGYVRLSFATHMETLESALTRISDSL